VTSPTGSFDRSDPRLARVALSALAEPTDTEAQRVVAEWGPVAVLGRILAGAGPARWRSRLAGLDPVPVLAGFTRRGGRVLIPGDAEWPRGVDDLGPGTPFCLWVRGPGDLAALSRRAVSVVGARAATRYGERVAADLAAGCAERGVTVVSGAAYGIDGAAHRAALTGGGLTVAVLAGGADRAYPLGHEDLIDRIAETGCVLSEVPPGSSPTRWRFLERNRIIAALSGVTVVVEAGHRSGSLGTAGRATGLGRTVAAVPGPVTSPMSYGTHRLLREGAVCVTDAAEVVELLGPIGAEPAPQAPVPAADHDGLSASDLRVFDALPVRAAASVESLARVAGLDGPTVRACLGRLHLRGLARREGQGWRAAR
jgi:DNA processing protein